MIIENLIMKVSNLHGNLQRRNGIFISSHNMDYFAEQLDKVDAKQGILLTPYLVNESGGLYELHYYEFDIEVRNEESHFNNYNPQNLLPKEITSNLKPQVIIAVADINFYQYSVMWYLANMRKMTFSEVKERYPEFENSRIFYEITVDTDLL